MLEVSFIQKRLQEYMEKTGWSLNEMNCQAGLSNGTLYHWWKGKKQPSIDGIQKLCNACNVSLSEFFATNDMEHLTAEANVLFDLWDEMNEQQRQTLTEIARTLLGKTK